MAGYAVQYLWENLESLLRLYPQYVAAYVAVAALISFAVCYYKGPVTDTRSLDLIKWTIQLIALGLIYGSTQIPEVSLTIIVMVVMTQVLSRFKFSFKFGIRNFM